MDHPAPAHTAELVALRADVQRNLDDPWYGDEDENWTEGYDTALRWVLRTIDAHMARRKKRVVMCDVHDFQGQDACPTCGFGGIVGGMPAGGPGDDQRTQFDGGGA